MKDLCLKTDKIMLLVYAENARQLKKLRAWSNTTIISYLNALTRKDAKTLTEAVSNLDRQQAQNFINEEQLKE